MIFARLEQIAKRHKKLQELISSPDTLADRNLYAKCAKEFAALGEIVSKHNQYKTALEEIEKIKSLLASKDHQKDKEFLELAKQERDELQEKKLALETELEEMLLEEEDSEQSKNIIMEIRAGTGGEEAALFVTDLYRMYAKYAAASGWKIEIMSSRPTEIGGFKEICFSASGKDVFKRLKYESGIHRVQRVPTTEASGRIHTSAVSVAVLPEPEEVEVKVEPKDLRVDVYRASGHGGQSVNTTDSAVRITHIPTGIVVSCQDERSQIKNKVKAMRVLRARVLDKIQMESDTKIKQERKSQVGTGDRSEKIRTYNFPDSRVTDHRIKLTIHKLEAVLGGDLGDIVSALIGEDRKRKLAQWKKE